MNEAQTLYREAFGHFANDRLDDAIETYKRCLEVDPGYVNGWNGLAMAHHKKGELEEALAAAKKLVELDPDDALGHTTLSRVYVDMGRIPEAEDERAIAIRLMANP